jgi:hypothetical protein
LAANSTLLVLELAGEGIEFLCGWLCASEGSFTLGTFLGELGLGRLRCGLCGLLTTCVLQTCRGTEGPAYERS